LRQHKAETGEPGEFGERRSILGPGLESMEKIARKRKRKNDRSWKEGRKAWNLLLVVATGKRVMRRELGKMRGGFIDRRKKVYLFMGGGELARGVGMCPQNTAKSRERAPFRGGILLKNENYTGSREK